MKIIKKSLVLAVVVLILLSMFSGCTNSTNSTNSTKQSTSSAQKITLVEWDTISDSIAGKDVDAFNRNFESQHPNITIKRTVIDWADLGKTLIPSLNSGNGPDMSMVGGVASQDQVAAAKAGLLLDLDKYSKKYKWNEKYQDWFLNVSVKTDGGKLSQARIGATAVGVFYNKKIFGDNNISLPTTFEEFLNACNQLKQKGIMPMLAPDKESWCAYWYESMFITAFTGNQTMNDVIFNKATFNTPGIVLAITALNDFYKKGYAGSAPLAVGGDEATKQFLANSAKGPAMIMTGTWNIPAYIKGLGDNVGFFNLPGVSAANTMPVAGIADAWIVSGKSLHPDEAADYVDQYCSPKNLKVITGCGLIPCFKNVSESDISALNLSPLMVDVITNISKSPNNGYNIDPLAPSGVNDITANDLQAMIAGKKTPQEVVINIQKAWEDSRNN